MMMTIRKLRAAKLQLGFARQCCSVSNQLFDIVSFGVGGLQEMEGSRDHLGVTITPSLVTHASLLVMAVAVAAAAVLRFFSWFWRKSSEELGDDTFNRTSRAFSEMKDITAVEITMLDLQKAGRRLDRETFAHVIEIIGALTFTAGLFMVMPRRLVASWKI